MDFHVLDEVLDLAGFGAALICFREETPANLREGMILRDATGVKHRVTGISEEEGFTVIELGESDSAALKKLMRNLFVDATLFTLLEEEETK